MNTHKLINELYDEIINDICQWKVEEKISQKCSEKLQSMRLEQKVSTKEQMQVFLHLKRNYNMIKFLIEKKYTKDEIDYYLFNNNLKEVSSVGLSFYFDIKFTKGTKEEFLYRCDGDKYTKNTKKEKNPSDDTFDKVTKDSDLVKILLQLSQIHVSKRIGNENKQRDWFESYSACLGRDLHKYFDPCGWENKTTLKIVSAEKLNTIKIGEDAPKTLQMASLQSNNVEQDIKYCWKNSDKKIADDSAKSVEFCIGMYNVRDNKNENFERWSKRFLSDDEWKTNLKETDVQNFTRGDRLLGAVPDMEIVSTREYLDSVRPELELEMKECIVLLYRYYEKYIEKTPYNYSKDKEELKKDLYDKTKAVLEEFEKKFAEEFPSKSEIIKDILSKIDDDASKTRFEDNLFKYVNWKKECGYMYNIYIDMQQKGQNKHVNPNIFYGLDLKERECDNIQAGDEWSYKIRDNDYREFMSKIKLTMLNEALYDGKKKIFYYDDNERYGFK